MKRLLASLLTVAATACGTTDPPPDLPPDVPWYGEPSALGVATSPCGRYWLRLDAASWETDPARRPRLSLQMSFLSDEGLRREGQGDELPDAAIVCSPARVTRLVPPDGTEFRENDLHGGGATDSVRSGGAILFHELELYQRTDRLQRLEVECRVLRVLSWRTIPLSLSGPGDEAKIDASPFRLGMSGDAGAVRIAAWCGDDLPGLPLAQRELDAVLSTDWVATGADLRDASGRRLWRSHFVGSGGATVASYGSFLKTNFPGAPRDPVEYPVSGWLRFPERWVIEVVPFEFTDLALDAVESYGPGGSLRPRPARGR